MHSLPRRPRRARAAAFCATLATLGLSVVCLAPAHAAGPEGGHFTVYVGTYTGPKSEGIYAFDFNAASGTVAELGCVANVTHPAFLALHPRKPLLYAVNEVNEASGRKTGAVTAFAVDRETGRLTAINQQSSGGAGPCHLTVDATGRCVLVANYGGGSVAVLPIRPDGALAEPSAVVQHTGSSVNPSRQREPHAHSINLSPDNRFAFVADLGIDQVRVYRFDPSRGTLESHDPPAATLAPGAGPRHFAFHPSGRWAYVINELQSTVTTFAYNAYGGRLATVQSVPTLPADFTGASTTAEIVVHPSGRFAYGSNRGHDSLAVFAISPVDGTLRVIEHVPTQGRTPRNFAVDPSGRTLWVANQGSDNLVVFRVDPDTGRLTATGQRLEVGSPVCVRFSPRP
ncbi:MAG: lactonase family protein [Verrucomicrobia bacterium]|nr:lactonase family protein [Verrucomicrobiota bacterium]